MNTANEQILRDIREQVRRMRGAYVEPSAVYLDREVYGALGRPQRICGVQAECDDGANTRWAVR